MNEAKEFYSHGKLPLLHKCELLERNLNSSSSTYAFQDPCTDSTQLKYGRLQIHDSGPWSLRRETNECQASSMSAATNPATSASFSATAKHKSICVHNFVAIFLNSTLYL